MLKSRLTALLTTFALVACSGGGEDTAKDSADAAAAAATAAGQAATTLGALEPVVLTESDVEHFVAALEDLQRAGVRHEARLGSEPSEARQLAEGLRGSSEAMSILQKHGFDLARFQVVSYSVALAGAAAEAEGSAPKMDEALANLEKMKGQLPKEQYDAMLAGLKASSGVVEDLQKQPEGNVELYKRYRERIERIGKEK